MKKYKPIEVSQVEMAFPTSIAMKILPPYEDIPEEFKNYNSQNKWTKIFSQWFFNGLPNAKFYPKKGVNAELAYSNIVTAMRSFEPKHEHKEAGVAYLMSLWFEDITYDDKVSKE